VQILIEYLSNSLAVATKNTCCWIRVYERQFILRVDMFTYVSGLCCPRNSQRVSVLKDCKSKLRRFRASVCCILLLDGHTTSFRIYERLYWISRSTGAPVVRGAYRNISYTLTFLFVSHKTKYFLLNIIVWNSTVRSDICSIYERDLSPLSSMCFHCNAVLENTQLVKLDWFGKDYGPLA
jgi:hypothetical protein